MLNKEFYEKELNNASYCMVEYTNEFLFGEIYRRYIDHDDDSYAIIKNPMLDIGSNHNNYIFDGWYIPDIIYNKNNIIYNIPITFLDKLCIANNYIDLINYNIEYNNSSFNDKYIFNISWAMLYFLELLEGWIWAKNNHKTERTTEIHSLAIKYSKIGSKLILDKFIKNIENEILSENNIDNGYALLTLIDRYVAYPYTNFGSFGSNDMDTGLTDLYSYYLDDKKYGDE